MGTMERMSTVCGCHIVCKSDLHEYECDFRIASFTADSGNESIKISTVGLLDIGVASSYNTINLLHKVAEKAESKVLLTVCDLRKHRLANRGQPPEKDDTIIKCSRFFRKLFMSESFALCQVSGKSGVDKLYTDYGLLSVVGGLQGVLYTGSAMRTLWKEFKVHSIVRNMQRSSGEADVAKSSVVPPSSSSRSRLLSSARLKGTPDLSQQSTLSRASSMEFKPSVDHRRDLEELYEGDFGSQDVSNQQTVVKVYAPHEEPGSQQFSRLVVPHSASQSSLHSAPGTRSQRGYEEPMDTFDLLVSSSQNSFSQNSYSQSSNSQESVASSKDRRRRSRSVLENEESNLFPQLQDSNMAAASVQMEPSAASNFYAYSPMLEESTSALRPRSASVSSAAPPPASFCSPNENSQKKSLFSTIMMGIGLGGFFGGKSAEDPGLDPPSPRQPAEIGNVAALLNEQVSKLEEEDDDAKTVSTLNDNLDFMEEDGAQPAPANGGASAGNTASFVGPDSVMVTPSKPTTRSALQSPGKVLSDDEGVLARRELYATRLPDLGKVLLTCCTSDVANRLQGMLESCLILRKISPFSCAQSLAQALRTNQDKASAAKKAVGKSKDSLPLRLVDCLVLWTKEKCRNNMVFVEDACFICALLTSLIVECMGLLHTSKPQIAALRKKLASVFNRYLLVSSSPCVENRITVYSLLAKEQPPLKKDLDYIHKKYSYLLSTFSIEKEEHMSPNTVMLHKNNVSMNVHFHIFVAILKVVFAQSAAYGEHAVRVVTEYDFGMRALQDSPELSQETNEDAPKPTQPLVSSGKTQMEKLDAMLGKRLRTDELRPVANLSSLMAESKPMSFSSSENTVSNIPSAINPPPPSVPLKRTNSLISKRQVLTHRGSMRPTITQSIPLPPPVQHNVMMSPTPAKRRRSTSPVAAVMNTPGTTTMSSSSTIIASTPFYGSAAVTTPQRMRQVTTPSKTSPKKSTRLF